MPAKKETFPTWSIKVKTCHLSINRATCKGLVFIDAGFKICDTEKQGGCPYYKIEYWTKVKKPKNE